MTFIDIHQGILLQLLRETWNGKHVISVLVLLLPGPILVDVHVEKFYLSLSFACVSRLSSLPVLFNIYLKF